MLRTSLIWGCNDVRKFGADAILFREIQCKKRDILMFKRCFQCRFGSNLVKFARITITRLFHYIARSLERCLNTWPNGLMFKQPPWDPANVNL